MGSRFQRFSIRLSRGWALLLLLIGAGLLIAYWIGPLESPPARIELVATGNGAASDSAVGQVRYAHDGTLVFAVPLAARNTGARTARPRRIALSVPSNFHVMSMRGRLTGTITPGLPMRRYVIELPAPRLPADSTMLHLPGLDTIYLAPDLPRYYCHVQGLSIPEFEPAPTLDAAAYSDVRIFYSFTDGRSDDRHTGLLTVALDPERIRVAPAPMPPLYSTVVRMPEAPAPALGPAWFAGARRAHCGDPMQPIELYTVLWENTNGGRMFTVFIDRIGRKRLYDLDRDGVIELETWDGDGDGYFEAMREARFETPSFLLPPPLPDSSVIAPDPVAPDAAWLALFNDFTAGPRRFAQSSLTAHPQLAALDTAGTAVDSSDAVRAAAERAGAIGADDPAIRAALEGLRPAEPAFVELFGDTAAGPFRFSRRAPVGPPVVAGSSGPDTERGRANRPATTPQPDGQRPLGQPRDAPDNAGARDAAPSNTAPRDEAPPRGRQPLGTARGEQADRAPADRPEADRPAQPSQQRQRREPLGTPVGGGGAP